jgi:hypothetical protein
MSEDIIILDGLSSVLFLAADLSPQLKSLST